MRIRTHIPTHTSTCTLVSRPSRLRHKRLLLLQQGQQVFLCQHQHLLGILGQAFFLLEKPL
jgi:hypothetical protein